MGLFHFRQNVTWLESITLGDVTLKFRYLASQTLHVEQGLRMNNFYEYIG